MNWFLELLGYIGSGMVLLSLMMTSLEKLRWVNMSGAVISAIYGALCETWPVVFLNLGTIAINLVQIFRVRSGKK